MTAITVSSVGKAYGALQVLHDVNFRVEKGEFVTLLGPSGCGKTTTLRCIAGLETPTSGAISIGGKRAYSSTEKINMPPEKRRLGMVFQSYAIWPHMSVFENVAYGLRAQKASRPDIAPRVERALDMVGLQGYGDRNAMQLSGGQQQRVALARSLVVEPEVLLLDEPLSNLDAKLRERMRFELKELQRRLGLTAVYVTHDQSEALALSDKIIVMEKGRVIQQGSSEQIYFDPQSRFVLDFIGQANLLAGTVCQYDAKSHRALVTVAGGLRLQGELPASIESGLAVGQPATVALRPEDTRVSTAMLDGGINNIAGRVVSQLFLGATRELLIAVGDHKIKTHISSEIHLSDGQEIWFTIAPEAVRIIP